MSKWYWAAINREGNLSYGWARTYELALSKAKNLAIVTFDMGTSEKDVMHGIPALWKTYDAIKKGKRPVSGTCKWCGGEVPTELPHADECDNCWEMRARIQREPEIALLMVIRVIETLKHPMRAANPYPGEGTGRPLGGSYKGSQAPLEEK